MKREIKHAFCAIFIFQTRSREKISDVNGLLDKMKQFISTRGLGEAFAEFVKSLEPKTMKERLAEKQKVVKEQTQQKSMHTQEHGISRKHNISTEL